MGRTSSLVKVPATLEAPITGGVPAGRAASISSGVNRCTQQ
jgi:hypothetical protein